MSPCPTCTLVGVLWLQDVIFESFWAIGRNLAYIEELS